MESSAMSIRGSVLLEGPVASSLLARGRAFGRLLWLEIKRSQGYWLLPIMIGLGIYVPSSEGRNFVMLWRNMSLAVLESFVIPATMAAALAAWLVGRDRRRRADDLVATLPGNGTARDLMAGITAGFWGLVGYAGIAAWFFGKAIRADAWGRPDLGLVAIGTLGILVMTLIGVLVGRLVPGRFSPLAALATCWVLIVGVDVYATSLPGGGQVYPLQLLSPYGVARRAGEVDGVFLRHTQSLVPEVLAWLVALAAVLGFTLVVLHGRRWLNVAGLVVSIVVMVLAARPLVDIAERGFSFDQVEGIWYAPVCDESGSFHVCLHPAYTNFLSSTVAEVNEVLGPVSGLEGVPQTLVQRGSLPPELNAGEGVLDGVGHPQVMLDVIGNLFPAPEDATGPSQRPASQIVIQAWLVQRGSMELRGMAALELFGFPAEVAQVWTDDGGSRWSRPADAAQAETVFAEMEAALARFSALSEEEQRAWLEANWDALRAGKLALDEMP